MNELFLFGNEIIHDMHEVGIGYGYHRICRCKLVVEICIVFLLDTNTIKEKLPKLQLLDTYQNNEKGGKGKKKHSLKIFIICLNWRKYFVFGRETKEALMPLFVEHLQLEQYGGIESGVVARAK